MVAKPITNKFYYNLACVCVCMCVCVYLIRQCSYLHASHKWTHKCFVDHYIACKQVHTSKQYKRLTEEDEESLENSDEKTIKVSLVCVERNIPIQYIVTVFIFTCIA